jgi:hypothetical protein
MPKPEPKSFVVFYSPGTLFSEQSVLSIESWTPRLAVELSKQITERHGAKPYGFRFEERLVAEPIPDGYGGTMKVEPKTLEKSDMFYLGGELRTYGKVVKDNDPNEHILRSNMRGNGYAVVIENRNSYRHTAPFEEGDKIVDVKTGDVIRTGSDPDLMEYRKQFEEDRKKERKGW